MGQAGTESRPASCHAGNTDMPEADQREETANGATTPTVLRSEGVSWQNYEVDQKGDSHLGWQVTSKTVEYGRDMNGGHATDLVGKIMIKGAVAYEFVSKRAAIRNLDGSVDVDGTVYVRDVLSGLHLKGAALVSRFCH